MACDFVLLTLLYAICIMPLVTRACVFFIVWRIHLLCFHRVLL